MMHLTKSYILNVNRNQTSALHSFIMLLGAQCFERAVEIMYVFLPNRFFWATQDNSIVMPGVNKINVV